MFETVSMPRVGDHRDRQGEDQLRPRRRRAEVHLVDQQARVEHEDEADDREDDLRREVEHGQAEVELRGLPEAADVERRQQRDHRDAADDVARRVLERRPERGQVVRHEERRDGDRDDVVERQRPAGEERRDLVERVASERRRAARLREHRRALRVRLRGQREQSAGQHEDDRRQPERMRRDEPQRVVDRGADVAVSRREQARHPDRPAQALLAQTRHASIVRAGASRSRADPDARR
jgi:hypothetical protein